MIYNFLKSDCVPARAVVWVMIFSACFFSYMLRVNMSINIIAMVNSSGKASNGSDSECSMHVQLNYSSESEPVTLTTVLPDYGPRYEWDQRIQGLLLGSYFWGYFITSLPGGTLAEMFGPKLAVGLTTLLSGILTAIIPLAASAHYSVVIAARFILGLMAGVTYPALHCLVSRWAPPVEKGKFIGALLGGTLGTVVTWPLLGAIIENMGWIWSFYIPAALTVGWCVLWFFLIFDYPDVHPRINEDEKNYIIKSLGDNISKTKAPPPYFKIFGSIPFWALVILHFGNLWGLYLLITGGPKFMSEALNFKLQNSGILAALPHLMRMIFGFGFGLVGDYLRKKELMSVTSIRKVFVIFSHFIPGLLLYCLIAVGCNAMASVALITLSLGSNGASTITNLQNNQDLAPNFAGTIYGIMNCIGGTTGFITPAITGQITAEKSGLKEWHLIFSIGATVYIACGIVFLIIGSGEQQPWNNVEQTGTTNKKTENTKV